jgi:hypothetical protein
MGIRRALAVFFCAVYFSGCASGPRPAGEKGPLEDALNALAPIEAAGKQIKFEFDRSVWYQKVDGKDFLAGTFEQDGAKLILTQTHIYSDEQKPETGGDIGWIASPGPGIILEYIENPPSVRVSEAPPEAANQASVSSDAAAAPEEETGRTAIPSRPFGRGGGVSPVPGLPAEEQIGLRAGLDLGANEQPFSLVRSTLIMPSVVYEKSIDEWDIFGEMKFIGDVGAPDPGEIPASKSRATWVGMYLAQEFGYNLDIDAVQRLSFMLDHENTFGFTPSFPDPESPEAAGLDTRLLYMYHKSIAGKAVPAMQYAYKQDFGLMYGRLGLPLEYAKRRMDDNAGVGLEVLYGYAQSPVRGFGMELACSVDFTPSAGYADTILRLRYILRGLYAELEIIAGDALKTWTFIPELNYTIDRLTFKAGFELGHRGQKKEDPFQALDVTFSPHMGIAWSF